MILGIGLARVSTGEQGENYSLPTQVSAIRQYASANGFASRHCAHTFVSGFAMPFNVLCSAILITISLYDSNRGECLIRATDDIHGRSDKLKPCNRRLFQFR